MTEQMTERVSFDPGPVPPPTVQDRLIAHRIRTIAAIHAMAQWLTDHPDAPTPHTIDMRSHPGAILDVADGPRVAAIDRFAAAHGAERYALGMHEYAKVILGTREHHGAEITYTLSTTRRDIYAP